MYLKISCICIEELLSREMYGLLRVSRKHGFPLVLRSEFMFHGVDTSVLCALRIPFGRAHRSTFPQPPPPQTWWLFQTTTTWFEGSSLGSPVPFPPLPWFKSTPTSMCAVWLVYCAMIVCCMIADDGEQRVFAISHDLDFLYLVRKRDSLPSPRRRRGVQIGARGRLCKSKSNRIV